MPLILSGDTGVPASGMPTGSVIQTVTATYSTPVTISTTTYTDTGLTATITPISATSKILVVVTQPYRHTPSAGGGGIIIVRNSTPITQDVADSVGPFTMYLASVDIFAVYSNHVLDSPATTSAITYKTQGRPYNGASGLYLQASGAVTNNKSTITLLEIRA